jgi:DNA-binding CsgD family transcriptional regulator
VAARAARQLGEAHAFTSHAWWIAGQGAQLSFDNDKASRYFDQAKNAAENDEDLRDALWGLVVAFSQAEVASAVMAVEQLVERRDNSPIDLVRAATAQIFSQRFTRLTTLEPDEAIHTLGAVTDPRVRAGFMNTYGYHLVITGEYEAAYELAKELHSASENYQLTWALPHAQWTLAAAALGRRDFGVADGWLRRVERVADEFRYGHLVLNAACLRARLLLALQRPNEACSALTVDETSTTSKAMRGEFLGTKALTFAVRGVSDECTTAAREAQAATKSVEAHAYAECAMAIIAQRCGDHEDVNRRMRVVEELGAWDAFVAAVRAWPPLLMTLLEAEAHRPSFVTALRNSRDFDLCRQVGLDLGRRPRHQATITSLSPREGEVLALVRQGFTNAAIARALFISESTVKVHVRHILEKTGARSRTEAATSLELDL